jgi:hypothetical protein
VGTAGSERPDGAALEQDIALLQELESNTSDEIIRQRAWSRIQVKARVVVQPGNTSEMRTMKVAGVTGDISSGGCQILLPIPLQVGDTYRLTFDRATLDLPMTFARCVRCRLIREDAFESGLAFFQEIELTDELVPGADRQRAA